jgi:hypothetical protein
MPRPSLDEIFSSSVNTNVRPSLDEIFVGNKSKPIVTSIPTDGEIINPKKPLGLKPMTVGEQAKAQNIGAISRLTGKRVSEVENNYEGKTSETGLKRTVDIGMLRDPTSKQLLQTIAHPAMTGALTAGAVTNPIGTALGLALGLPVFKGIDMATQKVEESLPKKTPSEVKELVGAGGYLAGLLAGGKILEKGPAMAYKISSKIGLADKSQKIANQLINSYLKPKHAESTYGNPGEGIAREGIIENNIGGLKTKVEARLKNLYSALDNAYQSHINKKADYETALNPIKNILSELNKNPKTNSAAISRVQNIIDDFTGVSTGNFRKFDSLNPLEARKLKQDVGGFIDWSYEGKANKDINKALKNSYNIIDSITDKIAPETKLLNKRVTDLSSAKKTLDYRIEAENKKEMIPSTWYGLFNLPFQVVRSTIFKTTLASVLSQKYPKLMQEQAAIIPEVMDRIPLAERKAIAQQVRLALPGASTKYGENFTSREVNVGDVVNPSTAPRSTFIRGKPATSGKTIMGEDFNLRDAKIFISKQKLLPSSKIKYGEGFLASDLAQGIPLNMQKRLSGEAQKLLPYKGGPKLLSPPSTRYADNFTFRDITTFERKILQQRIKRPLSQLDVAGQETAKSLLRDLWRELE